MNSSISSRPKFSLRDDQKFWLLSRYRNMATVVDMLIASVRKLPKPSRRNRSICCCIRLMEPTFALDEQKWPCQKRAIFSCIGRGESWAIRFSQKSVSCTTRWESWLLVKAADPGSAGTARMLSTAASSDGSANSSATRAGRATNSVRRRRWVISAGVGIRGHRVVVIRVVWRAGVSVLAGGSVALQSGGSGGSLHVRCCSDIIGGGRMGG